MPIVTINYVAVIVAAIAAYVLGMIWYAPAVFGKIWMKGMGKTDADIEKMKAAMKTGGKSMAGSYVLAFIGGLLTSYVLAHFVGYLHTTSAAAGVQLGFWLWLGFFATTTLAGITWEGKRWSWWFVTNGYSLVMLCLMGVILATWQ